MILSVYRSLFFGQDKTESEETSDHCKASDKCDGKLLGSDGVIRGTGGRAGRLARLAIRRGGAFIGASPVGVLMCRISMMVVIFTGRMVIVAAARIGIAGMSEAVKRK